jgi:hypothetical protein
MYSIFSTLRCYWLNLVETLQMAASYICVVFFTLELRLGGNENIDNIQCSRPTGFSRFRLAP